MKNTIALRSASRSRVAIVSGVLAGLAALALLAACQTVSPAVPKVSVSEQNIENGTVTISRVVSNGPGWLVVHADNNGAPGADLGWAPLKAGVNWNVKVSIDPAKAGEYLWAMLHVDVDAVGKYEFPGPDVPVTLEGKVVMKRFELTKGYVSGGGMGGGY